jgi:RNA polymerase sigma factor (sigma-70 family)
MGSELPESLADPADLPSQDIERLEDEQLVKAAVDGLGERCRKLLTMLYYPDLRTGQSISYEAVAKVMGIPVGSVGPTRIRCLKKLLAQYRKLSGK